MPVVIFEYGAIRVESRYLHQKGNVYYFRRRIPADVSRHYPDKREIMMFSLKTSDKKEAARLANTHALQQDALWRALRENPDLDGPELRLAAEGFLSCYGLKPGQWAEYKRVGIEPDEFFDDLRHIGQVPDSVPTVMPEDLPPYAALASDMFFGKKVVPTLTETVELHNKLKGQGGDAKATSGQANAVELLLSIAGDLPMNRYAREHARAFVDTLLKRGVKTTTVKRYINYISPVFNTAIAEYTLSMPNVFANLTIAGFGEDKMKRPTFTLEELRAVQKACVERDDDMRWAIAMASDTGMRVAEIVGLRIDEIVLDKATPYVHVKKNEARRIKTEASSDRKVPLVGSAFWAAQRIVAEASQPYAFPRYIKDGAVKADHASNSLNKWLKSLGTEKTMHSFRHTLRDRLRNVGTPTDAADRIGGWSSSRSVGESYGQGHDVAVLHEWMRKIEL